MAKTRPSSRAVRTSGKQASSRTTPTSSLVRTKSRLRLSVPRMDTSPPSRDMAFISRARVVDFPAPFSPTRPRMVPAGRAKLMRSKVKPS